MNKIVLITGATAGIGRATAIRFAEHGYSVIITGRRGDRLQELEKIITSTYGVKVFTLQFDIRHHQEVIDAIHSLPHEWREINVLINNAGLAAGLATIDDASVTDFETMIDTNIKGLLYITKEILPFMIQKNSGHIINMSSIAGRQAYLRGNVYSATKFAVEGLTRSMRIDLLPHKIKVSSVSPGAVETDFSLVRFKNDAERAKVVYKGFQPLVAEDIADIIWFIASRPAHVSINDIEVTPIAQSDAHYIHREE